MQTDAPTLLPLADVFTSLVVGRSVQHAGVGIIELARPKKFNAFDQAMWDEFPRAITALEAHPDVRAIVVAGQGRHFCAGIDTGYLAAEFGSLLNSSAAPADAPHGALKHQAVSGGPSQAGPGPGPGACPGHAREAMRRSVLRLQDALTCLERCRLPVIAAVHGMCIGGGVDLVTAADIRLASDDASFCVKEVDLAIAADLGTLQRLPHIVGHGVAIEMALTARTVPAAEALSLRLVSSVVAGGRAGVLGAALELGARLAAKPALALMGTKRVMLHARDNPRVSDGLDYVATWNSAQLVSSDLAKVLAAGSGGRALVGGDAPAQPPASALPRARL